MRWFLLFSSGGNSSWVPRICLEEIDRLVHRAESFQSWARLTREIFRMSEVFLTWSSSHSPSRLNMNKRIVCLGHKSGLKDEMEVKGLWSTMNRALGRLLSPVPPFLMKHGVPQNLEGPGIGKLKLITVWATKVLPWLCGRDRFYLISFSSYFSSSPLSIFGLRTRATRNLFPVQSRWLEQNTFNAPICPHFISINMAASQARLLSIYLSLVQPSSP